MRCSKLCPVRLGRCRFSIVREESFRFPPNNLAMSCFAANERKVFFVIKPVLFFHANRGLFSLSKVFFSPNNLVTVAVLFLEIRVGGLVALTK